MRQCAVGATGGLPDSSAGARQPFSVGRAPGMADADRSGRYAMLGAMAPLPPG
jgi:hypothetical protein